MSHEKKFYMKSEKPALPTMVVAVILVLFITSISLDYIYFHKLNPLIKIQIGNKPTPTPTPPASAPLVVPPPPKEQKIVFSPPLVTADFYFKKRGDFFTEWNGTNWQITLNSISVIKSNYDFETGKLNLNFTICNTGSLTAPLDDIYFWHTSASKQTINWSRGYSLTLKPGECRTIDVASEGKYGNLSPVTKPLGTLFISPDGASVKTCVNLSTAQIKEE